MKIILMSDSHGRDTMIDYLLDKYKKEADLFVHCGDIEADPHAYPELKIVAGNNDLYYDYPDMLLIQAKSHRILVVHSHHCGFMGNRLRYLSNLAKEKQCDMVFYGHTHIADYQNHEGVICVNPGSLRYSRDGRKPSYAIVDIDEDIQVQFEFEPFS